MSGSIYQYKPRLIAIRELYRRLAKCDICPRECLINRFKTKKGVCRSGYRPVVSSVTLHFGEEPPITGFGGSGTIFLANCNLSCVYCQNYPISQMGVGNEASVAGLVSAMFALEKKGASNVNFVTPTHFTPQIAHAIYCAKRRGLAIPIVWNSSGYEKREVIRLLDGLVDIYLVDYRYATAELAKNYSSAPDYPEMVEGSIEEMVRQTGMFDGRRGVVIRQLFLPGHLEETKKILMRIRERFGAGMAISFLTQFFPAYKADKFPEINRRLTDEEIDAGSELLSELGFDSGWVQGI